MKISFDLDGTLIPFQKNDFKTIKPNCFQKILEYELLRDGTIELFKTLKENGHQVGIYTYSFRSKFYIMTSFLSHGIFLDFIINEKQNRDCLSTNHVFASKYPPIFNIDLHVDDAKGVKLESEKFNFRLILLKKDGLDWSSYILEKIIHASSG